MKTIIAFDAEFATQEILELSIYTCDYPCGTEPREIFHSLFRPETERRWPGSERVHHISPAMVRNKPFFRRHRDEIQSLIDSADCLVGFDIKNDIEALRREGVQIDDDKPVVDVRDLYWVLVGRHAGVELDARKGLGVTATELGIEFSENDAHESGYDTLKTVECFRLLMSRFMAEFADTSASGTSPADFYALYKQQWDALREEYLENFARGWVSLIETRDGYRIKATRQQSASGNGTVAQIEVKARWRALNEIDAHFNRRRHKDHPTLYVLKKPDIDWFLSYRNEYDANEPMHHQLLKLRQSPFHS